MLELINTHMQKDYPSPYASQNKEAIRFSDETRDIRTPYFRDIDRIIYSLSYTRYIDKTQVFSNISNNDHISKRMTHVQMVSKIARTIGRALGLNEDLIEAAALGHDLGHTPFGHVGESLLNKISLENDEGYFNHNVQSVRLLMNLENHGYGNNISLQVLDAILCHNGELVQKEYSYESKTKEEFIEQYNSCYIDKEIIKKLKPMTLEGAVVRISDVIGYIGRDIEDALRLGVLKKEELPKNVVEVLGNTNKEIINTVIMDIIENSINKPYIKMSDEVSKAIIDLKQFNYDKIYSKANSKKKLEEYETMFRYLFKKYVEEINSNDYSANIFKNYLNDMNDDYKEKTTPERKAIDYISGMTDDYFMLQYKSYRGNN